MLKNSPLIFKIFFAVIIFGIIFSVVNYAIVEYKDMKDGCNRTGEQRLVNSVLNAPEGAFSGMMVEDKFVCKDGRVTWKAQYQ